MGNSKSKKSQKEPDRFFEREKWKQKKRDDKRSKPLSGKKRGPGGAATTNGCGGLPPPPAPRPASSPGRTYDEEAVERMRQQLHNDSDAFLLNNILLSVQFFENYERETHSAKSSATPEWDSQVNESMAAHNKHVFLADKLVEGVHEHVRFRRARGRAPPEPLCPPRLFVVYDNIEASEPGDTSDYSAVLDAPFYKMLIEETKEPGYINLKKIEILQSTSNDQMEKTNTDNSEKSDYTDSEKESNSSDDSPYPTKSQGEALLLKLKSKLENSVPLQTRFIDPKININEDYEKKLGNIPGRRPSGPMRQISSVAAKATLSNLSRIKKSNVPLGELNEKRKSGINKADINNSTFPEKRESITRPSKSILKTTNNRRPSGPMREPRAKFVGQEISKETSITEETETSGYRSNSNSSAQNESSGTDSDYGYATISKVTTPKPLLMSSRPNMSESTGIVPEDCWTAVQVKTTSYWSDDDEDDDSKSKDSTYKTLYETNYYLNSIKFMGQFVDIFMTKLGRALGFSTDAIENALTQGASIYCDTIKNHSLISYEVIPAVIAAWPNSANEWIIRQRRIIQNPRTNFSYQWPTKYMVNKARGYGCLLVPVGYRPKKGSNPDQELQWRLIFPAAERYLESCLAHSQVRCYLFTIALVKTFMENETSKIGIDASHIKNHLFWQCEDNYARWPEDRLGETLRIFLRTLYRHFGQARFPDYFVETSDNFKSIPKTMLLKLQRRLADILESPVMHMLCAIKNLKYTSKDFYPQFDYIRLYRILTTKNVLRLINPNLHDVGYVDSSSASEDEYKDAEIGFWDKAKSKDKQYQWRKEQQRQTQARRKAIHANAQKAGGGPQIMDPTLIVPARMDLERRRLVLEFFIGHFISMALYSDKFKVTKQAIIYLEQAQRLNILLREEPGGDQTAEEYSDTIRSKLNDCKLKLVEQSGLKLPKRNESIVVHNYTRTQLSQAGRVMHEYVNSDIRECRDSPPPPPSPGIQPFTFVDIHMDQPSTSRKTHSFILEKESEYDSEEDSKL